MGERAMKCTGGRLHWHKYKAYTGVISRVKSQCTMNRHLNNEGQEWQTDHTKGSALMGEGG
jgi:hypothetical protein